MNNVAEKVKEHYDKVVELYGDRVFFVSLYGSQNYGTDTRNSDVDTKALIIPSFDDLLKREKISKDIECAGGICDIKHIDLMFNNFIKSNINFLELLYPKEKDYTIVNPLYEDYYQNLMRNRDEISSCNEYKLLMSTLGMAKQLVDKILEDGINYRLKNYSNLKRLFYFLNSYCVYRDFEKALRPPQLIRDNLIDLKTNYYDPEIVEDSVIKIYNELKDIETNIILSAEYFENKTERVREYLYQLYKNITYKYSCTQAFWEKTV